MKEEQEARDVVDDTGEIHKWELDMLERDNPKRRIFKKGLPSKKKNSRQLKW